MKDKDRLLDIINEEGENIHSFALGLGFDRSDGIRDIITGRKKRKDGSELGISKELAIKINEKYPKYSKAWICFGEGEKFSINSSSEGELKEKPSIEDFDKNRILKFSLKTTMDFLQKVVDSFDISDDKEGDRLLREIAAYGHPDSRPENNKNLQGNNKKKDKKNIS